MRINSIQVQVASSGQIRDASLAWLGALWPKEICISKLNDINMDNRSRHRTHTHTHTNSFKRIKPEQKRVCKNLLKVHKNNNKKPLKSGAEKKKEKSIMQTKPSRGREVSFVVCVVYKDGFVAVTRL